MSVTISFMDKDQKDLWLPKMFDLLYENMQVVAPNNLPYEAQKAQFLSEVSPALEKAPRQVILCVQGNTLVGFLQYYTREDLLVIEEVQLRKEFQRTLTFYHLCKFISASLPKEVAFLEAYTHKSNHRSQKLLQKLGLSIIEDGPFLHFRGSSQKAKEFFS